MRTWLNRLLGRHNDGTRHDWFQVDHRDYISPQGYGHDSDEECSVCGDSRTVHTFVEEVR